MLFSLLLLNLVFCIYALYKFYDKKSLLVFFWGFNLYQSFIMFFSSFAQSNTLEVYAGYSAAYHVVFEEGILYIQFFILTCNVLMYIFLQIWYGFFLKDHYFQISDFSSININNRKTLVNIYLFLYFFSFIGLFINYRGLGYKEFVEYSGSNWALVFFYVSAPFGVLCLLERRYKFIFFFLIGFSYFTYLLNIRSFMIMSVLPMIMAMYILHTKNNINIFKYSTYAFVLLVFFSLISYNKVGYVSLPEVELKNIMYVVIDTMNNNDIELFGFESICRFFSGIFGPFLKFFGINIIGELDPPVFFASIYHGYSAETNLEGFYHYPALWYSDFYAAFGFLGAGLILFWSMILVVFERLLFISPRVFVFFIPSYAWFLYAFFRGAIGNSTIAMQYPFYIQLFLFIALGFFLKIWKIR